VLSLIVNELMTNAFKHAYCGRDTGYLLVTLGPSVHGRACLSVIDDGPGFAGTTAAPAGKGMGLVEALADAIDGKVSISGGGSEQTKVSVTFQPLRQPPDPGGEGR
jgi:two-component sensor histidine kinase